MNKNGKFSYMHGHQCLLSLIETIFLLQLLCMFDQNEAKVATFTMFSSILSPKIREENQPD